MALSGQPLAALIEGLFGLFIVRVPVSRLAAAAADLSVIRAERAVSVCDLSSYSQHERRMAHAKTDTRSGLHECCANGRHDSNNSSNR